MTPAPGDARVVILQCSTTDVGCIYTSHEVLGFAILQYSKADNEELVRAPTSRSRGNNEVHHGRKHRTRYKSHFCNPDTYSDRKDSFLHLRLSPA